MKILVGLGNPGDKYAQNRHNVGFMALDAIAEQYNAGPWRRRFQGLACEAEIERNRVLLLKPATYMNESGRSAGEAVRFYKISAADIIVFHDEIDLEPGKLRVKFGGGAAGHNGLKSLSAHISNDYQRVRIGVGHPGSREAVAHYVLNDFSRADAEWLAPMLDAIAKGAPSLIAGEDAKFMNEVARVSRPAARPKTEIKAKAPAKPAVNSVAAVNSSQPELKPEEEIIVAAPKTLPPVDLAPVASTVALDASIAPAAETAPPPPSPATSESEPKAKPKPPEPAMSVAERELKKRETSLGAKIIQWLKDN